MWVVFWIAGMIVLFILKGSKNWKDNNVSWTKKYRILVHTVTQIFFHWCWWTDVQIFGICSCGWYIMVVAVHFSSFYKKKIFFIIPRLGVRLIFSRVFVRYILPIAPSKYNYTEGRWQTLILHHTRNHFYWVSKSVQALRQSSTNELFFMVF